MAISARSVGRSVLCQRILSAHIVEFFFFFLDKIKLNFTNLLLIFWQYTGLYSFGMGAGWKEQLSDTEWDLWAFHFVKMSNTMIPSRQRSALKMAVKAFEWFPARTAPWAILHTDSPTDPWRDFPPAGGVFPNLSGFIHMHLPPTYLYALSHTCNSHEFMPRTQPPCVHGVTDG